MHPRYFGWFFAAIIVTCAFLRVTEVFTSIVIIIYVVDVEVTTCLTLRFCNGLICAEIHLNLKVSLVGFVGLAFDGVCEGFEGLHGPVLRLCVLSLHSD